MLTINDIEKYMVLKKNDGRLFVVCDLFDGDFAACPASSNHIYLKEVNKNFPAKKIPIDQFKKSLDNGEVSVWKG